ncbi:MAG TPA: cyclohexanone monooxygenase, partial [Pseudolysinimonas sp.]|nr:cyclohexanone monooxygenase [Pseudolysinimonas sp.]
QRTPNFTLPARNRPLYRDELAEARRRYREIRDQCETSPTGTPRVLGHQRVDEVPATRRREMLELEWKRGGVTLLAAFADGSRDLAANAIIADFVRERIHTIVEDEQTADRLTPRGYPIGGKRIALDTDYYATFNLPHVDLVDLRSEPLVELTENGLRTTAGDYELDTLVLATGFDAMTGPLTRMDIRGRGGRRLVDEWRNGPRNLLGLAVAGFPNLFTVTGPGSPSVLVNVLRAIEQHVDWILDCLLALRDRGIAEIEATTHAQDAWVATVNEIADSTLYVHADSWYLGANIPGKPRVFMPYAGGLAAYRASCDDVANSGYRGFELRTAPAGPSG